MKIIERIYEELETQGKNAADLARHLGVTTAQTTAWKQRKTDPPAKYISLIAEFLERSVNYILTGTENNQIETKSKMLTYGSSKKEELKNKIDNIALNDNQIDLLLNMINTWV